MKRFMIGIVVLVLGLGVGAHEGGRSHVMLTADEMKWGDAPAALPPGAKVAVIEGDLEKPGALFTFRAKFPDGYRVPPHFHPADEHITVISGTFHMGMGDRFDPSTGRAMPAGSYVIMPKGEHHYAWTTGETVVQVHAIGPWGITYVNPAEDPRSKAK
jgi:quercetin dioxygenase-like cupin family protein